MANYDVVAPPYVDTGKFLSAYFTNQLSDVVNYAGGTVFGANVPRWIENSSDTLQEQDNIFSLVHRYATLRIKFNFGNTDMLFKVFLSTDDNVMGIKVYEATTTSSGPLTLSFNLDTNPSGFSVAYGQLYFVRIYASEVGTSSDFWQIDSVQEVGVGTIVKPVLSDITASTVITQSYLNSLVNAARDLRLKLQPNSIPFVGFTLNGSQSRDGTFVRYKFKHISRWLHYGFKAAESGGGADGVKFYFNNLALASFSNNNNYYAGAWDTNALPNGLTTPTLGQEYEIKVELNRTAGSFQLFYLWELPYL
jgi:hypothetical protein